MVYDDIVIGSGLAALGTVLGLAAQRRVLVLGGPPGGTFAYYDARRVVPCAFHGRGGLGNDWHGVIPLSRLPQFAAVTGAQFAGMFRHFYPRTPLPAEPGPPRLFVPWRPIRPAMALQQLAAARSVAGTDSLRLAALSAVRFDWGDGRLAVVASDGSRHATRRLWIAAGAVHTPELLHHSLGRPCTRGLISDHVVCYAGQLHDQTAPAVARTRDGVLFPAHYDDAASTLYTLRPARFGFRQLDFGIEQRAVFGLPTGSAVAKIMRRMSPGLLAEALYNRAGLFPTARTYSLYAQTRVADAYELGGGELPLRARPELILRAARRARESAPFPDLQRSRRHDLYIPGIHLHDSVDRDALRAYGINAPHSPVQVVDASVIEDIGPDHHSFRMMLVARARAAASGASGTAP